jgi:hypothetical protein
MDYTYIHDKIITTTYSLKLVPAAQLEGVLGQFGILNPLVREMQHQAITVMVHAHGQRVTPLRYGMHCVSR